jgi:hypothetical protein
VIDLVGQKFGRLEVIKQVGKNKWGHTRWLCRCNCIDKSEIIVLNSNLKSGHTKSCGCVQKKEASKRFTIHGRSQNNKTYQSWEAMIQRCNDPNARNYYLYGGRGIKVCKHWTKFINFLNDIGERPTKNHSIDRINNNGNYCKENCRWATKKEQARNRRDNHYLTYNNRTQLLVEWSEETGIPINVLKGRIRRKWSVEKSLTTPVERKK